MSTTSKKPPIDPKSTEETNALKTTFDMYKDADDYHREQQTYKNQILDQLDMVTDQDVSEIQERQQQEQEKRENLIKLILDQVPDISHTKLNQLSLIDLQYHYERLLANDREYLYMNLRESSDQFKRDKYNFKYENKEDWIKPNEEQQEEEKPANVEHKVLKKKTKEIKKKSWFARLMEFFLS